MSNVKKPLGHSAVDTISKPEVGLPPRYQPPPQPPGILKYHNASRHLERPPQKIIGPPEYPAPPPVNDLKKITLSNHLQDSNMLKFVRKTEADVHSATTDPSIERKDVRLQAYLAEIRTLKELNMRLSDDNQELRDLCCFLDDDRQKGRKLAREWQRFGRYTASVMRQEVSAYQTKLRQLERRQQELIKDNLELKELCLYLDEERQQSGRPGRRDEGDGSSSSTNADDPAYPSPRSALEEAGRRSVTAQVAEYVRGLEARLSTLERDRHSLIQRLVQMGLREEECQRICIPDEGVLSRPEAVVRALQVLEVREELDKTEDEVDTGESALVREMCNVVWRKLEEGPTGI